jgi:hypothetical protein
MTYLDTHPRFAMAVDAYPPHARLKSGADPCFKSSLAVGAPRSSPYRRRTPTPNA